MDEHQQKLWALFSSLFAGEWVSIYSISLGQTLAEGKVKLSLRVTLTLHVDKFPGSDYLQADFGPAESRGESLDSICADVLSQLGHSAAKARSVRLEQLAIAARVGQRLLIRGDFWNWSADGSTTQYRDRVYAPGSDRPCGPGYIDLPAFNFKASEHRVAVSPGSIGTLLELREGYMRVLVDGLRDVWIPTHELRPSILSGNNGMKPIVGTEHCVWIG